MTEIWMKRLASAAIIALTTLASAAHAGEIMPPIFGPSKNSESETRLFAGLNWTFGKQGGGLSTRVGAIYTDIDSDDDVQGARVFLDLDLFKQGGTPSVFVTGFKGTTYGMGELGLGYDFGNGEMIGQFGGLMNHFEIGGNYGFSGSGMNGYVGVTSFKFDKVQPNAPYEMY
ncbi:hypothetical protein BMG00_07420 [Thioclava marina]|uniref:Outer membrane protein beta-barrel domain-containing protein n=2 Tax=Thioclava marina TaxID=1915077 RepID=A0ABX3MPV9_9RHOB|nr:hypothetical protein BMG00_07420 [Thioclava marina]